MSFFSQVFGFIATIVFALDFYLIFNELANFLKQGGESNDEPSRQQGKSFVCMVIQFLYRPLCIVYDV